MTTKNTDLLTGLNEDLAHEYQAVVMYNTYASRVVGPYRKELDSKMLQGTWETSAAA
jgi:bacterioferritin